MTPRVQGVCIVLYVASWAWRHNISPYCIQTWAQNNMQKLISCTSKNTVPGVCKFLTSLRCWFWMD